MSGKVRCSSIKLANDMLQKEGGKRQGLVNQVNLSKVEIRVSPSHCHSSPAATSSKSTSVSIFRVSATSSPAHHSSEVFLSLHSLPTPSPAEGQVSRHLHASPQRRPPQDNAATTEHLTTDPDKHDAKPASSPSSPAIQVAESGIFFASEPDVCSQSSSVYDNPLQQHTYHQLPQQHAFQTSIPQHNQSNQLEPNQSVHHSPDQHRVASSSPQHITFAQQSPYHQSRHNSPLPLLEGQQQEPQQETDIYQDPGPSQSPFPAVSLNDSYAVINPDGHSHNSHIFPLASGGSDTQSLTQLQEMVPEAALLSMTSNILLSCPPSDSLHSQPDSFHPSQSWNMYQNQDSYVHSQGEGEIHLTYQPPDQSCLPLGYYSSSCSVVDQSSGDHQLLHNHSTEAIHNLQSEPSTALHALSLTHPCSDQSNAAFTNDPHEALQIASNHTRSANDSCLEANNHLSHNIPNDPHSEDYANQLLHRPDAHHPHHLLQSLNEPQIASLLDSASQDTHQDDNTLMTATDAQDASSQVPSGVGLELYTSQEAPAPGTIPSFGYFLLLFVFFPLFPCRAGRRADTKVTQPQPRTTSTPRNTRHAHTLPPHHATINITTTTRARGPPYTTHNDSGERW
ncbi:hypothetical protein E2C01_008520 [Portunus trituberculatus]|uniref:Uncharacterized protein n=1 Tax=Portunus trituberculatus TaxID=210409 RepID=A0A5B7D236_PORTR|nr:hypothetical protein [Portunus trituberculatus]